MKYISTLIISTVLAWVIYYLVILALAPLPIQAEYWVREMIAIKLEIAKKYSHHQKIIIASGSNTLFGVNASRLSSDLCVPTINLGLHAGLSLENILDVAGKAVVRGDVLILPLENSKYHETSITAWQARSLIAWQPELWRGKSLLSKFEIIHAIGPRLFLELINTKLQTITDSNVLQNRLVALDDESILKKFNPTVTLSDFEYSAYNLNKFGDMRKTEGDHYLGKAGYSPEKTIIISQRSRKALNEFINIMRIKGVAVYFANIPYLKNKEFNLSLVKKSSERLRADLSELAPLIDDKQDLIFNRKLFFNTNLHLNSQGREMNTNRLEKIIASLLVSQGISHCSP